MIPLRGPLCAGEAFSLRPRGRGGVISHGETWGPGRNSFLVPSPHISPLCWLRQKGEPFPIFHVRTYTALKAPDVTCNRTVITVCLISSNKIKQLFDEIDGLLGGRFLGSTSELGLRSWLCPDRTDPPRLPVPQPLCPGPHGGPTKGREGVAKWGVSE